jgi:hypothetical protein
MFLLRYGAQRGRCRILSCKLAARLRVARDDHTRSLQLALVVAEGFAQLNHTWFLSSTFVVAASAFASDDTESLKAFST